MNTEQGLVLEVNDDVAKIKVGRHSDCKNCGACSGNESINIYANNKIGARPGERVIFEVKEADFLGAAFIVFILPLIALFIGVVLGGFIGKGIGLNIPIFQVIGGIISLVLSIIIIKKVDKKAKVNKTSLPVIIHIIK